MARQKQQELVRYVSPFGSPAWMPREQAETLCQQDDRLWLRLQQYGLLSEPQREIGLPRIQTADERRRELDARPMAGIR